MVSERLAGISTSHPSTAMNFKRIRGIWMMMAAG
jgi:hypothetical protein